MMTTKIRELAFAGRLDAGHPPSGHFSRHDNTLQRRHPQGARRALRRSKRSSAWPSRAENECVDGRCDRTAGRTSDRLELATHAANDPLSPHVDRRDDLPALCGWPSVELPSVRSQATAAATTCRSDAFRTEARRMRGAMSERIAFAVGAKSVDRPSRPRLGPSTRRANRPWSEQRPRRRATVRHSSRAARGSLGTPPDSRQRGMSELWERF